MPAGDLIEEDDQVELRAFLAGPDEKVQITAPGIGGLGPAPAKTKDVDLEHDDGSYAPPDRKDKRTITVPLLIFGDDEADAMAIFDDLSVAWEAGDDEELHLQLAGWGHVYYVGRPRGLVDDMSLVKGGVINCLGTFVALKPARFAVGS